MTASRFASRSSTFLFLMIILLLGTTGCHQPKHALRIMRSSTVRYGQRWQDSAVKYTNAQELVRQSGHFYRHDDNGSQAIEAPRIRMLITVEQRTNRGDAIQRLVDIAASRSATAEVYEIGGWPAVEIRFTEPMPRRGDRHGEDISGPPPIIQRAIVAIAVDQQLLKFDIWPTAKDTEHYMREAIWLVRSFRSPTRENADELRGTLDKLRQNVLHKSAGGGNGSGISNSPRIQGSLPGAASAVQGGIGELEIAASSDATKIVIASNDALSFSSDAGATFTRGNTGVFGLNDPSMSRAVSGNFYLGVIAEPTGTTAQKGLTGCTNAVSRSVDNGANFALQGFSAECPATGDGMCFPDQPHVAADAFNSSSNVEATSDQLYAVWRNFTAVWPSTPANCKGINSFDSITSSITCSKDNGVTWTAPAAIPGAGDFPRAAVGQDGKVYVISLSGNGVVLDRFASCANGLSLDTGFPVTVANLNGTLSCPISGLDRCNDGNTMSSPTVAPDPANASHLFVSYSEDDGHSGDRVVTRESNDGGMTFPNRSTVSAASSARRFMPWSCSTLGTSVVGWYDRGAALASGATNDLTDYVVSGPAFASVLNLSNNPDPQCASGWQCSAPRSQNDSESCTVQPQQAGTCLNGSKGSGDKCDFSSGSCPSGESCKTGSGCPKYGDYNGIACANNSLIAAWTSATAPAGLAPVSGLRVFSSVVSLQKMGPPTFDRLAITLMTGHDNAGSGVEIAASLSGQANSICLKPSTDLAPDGICSNGSGAVDQHGNNTWDNWSSTPLNFTLDTPQASTAGFGSITITLLQHGCSLSCDNWDIQGITVVASDSTGTLSPTTLIDISNPNDGGDSCTARLKGSPNATMASFGLDGSNSHVYVDGTGSEPGATTTCKNNGD